MARTTRRLGVLVVGLLPLVAAAEPPAPNLQVELVALDPAGAAVLPLDGQVHGRIRYTTDAPVRLFLLPYRDGLPLRAATTSGSPLYAPGSGETTAWFAFSGPERIDEVRVVADDGHGRDLAEVGLRRRFEWRQGVATVPAARWVAELRAAPKQVVEPGPPDPVADFFVSSLVQFLFLSVPASVVLQIWALKKLEGRARGHARVSACVMGALWLFVLVTGLAGSNLSPIWLVLTAPLFVAWLLVLLIREHRRAAAA